MLKLLAKTCASVGEDLKNRIFAFAAVAVLSGVASAQVVHTGRYSKINYSYVYGAGGDVFQGTDFVEDSSLLGNDFEQLMFSQSNSGVLNGTPWNAGVSTNQVHTFQRLGDATNMTNLQATGQTDLTAHLGGPAVAVMHNTNPGNVLTQNFTVVTSHSYSLSGEIILPPAALPGQVLLQKFNGFNWDSVYNSWSLPGQTGPFSVQGQMLPGEYRITAALYDSAQGNTTKHLQYNYSLNFTPFTYHLASNYTVTGGLEFGGNLASLQSSDDNYLIVLNDEFDSTGAVEFTSNLSAGTTSELRFTFEGSAVRNDSSQIMRMFNHATQTWTTVNVRTATTSDSTVTGAITTNAGNYVGSGGQVKAEVQFIPQTDLTGIDGWTESCDFVQWTRVP